RARWVLSGGDEQVRQHYGPRQCGLGRGREHDVWHGAREGFRFRVRWSQWPWGLLVIDGGASLRCGISMKGIDIVVGGRVGNYSAFMAQAGHLVVCGDAGDALGDSLYEAVLYVRGRIKSLGADARIEDMTASDYGTVGELLRRANFSYDPHEFKRV